MCFSKNNRPYMEYECIQQSEDAPVTSGCCAGNLIFQNLPSLGCNSETKQTELKMLPMLVKATVPLIIIIIS